MKSLKDLEFSPIVANNSMNRERKAVGVNSYEKDMDLNPIEFISQRLAQGEKVHWIDLCCGRANALIETASFFQDKKEAVHLTLTGIDLVNFFSDASPYQQTLQLHCQNLEDWKPASEYDLITIVHGLHYVGDKLKLIRKCVSSLKADGLFMAHLDLNNIQIEGASNSPTLLKKYFKEQQIDYNARKRLIKVEGRKVLGEDFRLIGVDDDVGANYTGQAAVNSIYERV